MPVVVSWAGARGVLPLAAALSIPLTAADGSLLPYRDLVLVLATAVIVITLVVQGFTLAPLVRRTGIALDPQDVHQEHTTARLDRVQARNGEDQSAAAATATYRELRCALLAVEGAELNRLYEAGMITDTTRRRIQRTLDLENAGLGDPD